MQKYSLILIVCFGMDKRNVALFSSCFLICQGGNPSYKTRKILDKFHCPLYRHSLIRFTPCYRSSKSRIMGLESFDLTGSSFIATMGQYFSREKNPFNAKNPFNVSSFSIKMNGVNAYYLTPNS